MSVGEDVLRGLSHLVDTLTTSGSQVLDQELFKRVKNICKSSDENVRHLYRMVMSQLEKQHAEIRLSSLQIINEIFLRSHAFRELLTDNLQQFFELTIGTNADIPLPEPASVAKKLKNQSFQAIEKWHEKYGSFYKKLTLGYKYLKRVKKFEFDGMRSYSALERQTAQDVDARRADRAENKLNAVLDKMAETVSEIKNVVTEMNNCFHLVLPRPEEFDIYEESMNRKMKKSDYNQPSTNQDFGQSSTSEDLDQPSTSHDYNQPSTSHDYNQPSTSHDYNQPSTSHDYNQPSTSHDYNQPSTSQDLNHPSKSECAGTKRKVRHKTTGPSQGTKICGQSPHNINITVNATVQIAESEDNTDILNTLREQYKQVTNKHLPMVQKWLGILTKHGGHNENLVQAIDLKNSLTAIKNKFESLIIVPIMQSASKSHSECSNFDEQNDSEEEGFVDVPEKEGIEHIPAMKRHEYGLEPLEHSSDQAFKDKSCMVDTFLWNPNGHPGDSMELGDPCSRATAVAAFLQKQKEKAPQFDVENIPTQSSLDSDVLEITGHPSTDENRAKLLKRAPVVPFDMDLYHWGKAEEEAPSVSNLKSLHCFWSHGSDVSEDHCPGDIKESLKSRTITFTGEFQEVKWACHARLPSGKLCPRRDRFKCPFHGKIIPRDAMGRPSQDASEEDESLDMQTAQETEAITKDIELATGINLTNKETKKGKKRKHPGLTDLKKNASTSRSRLEKIVFDKSSLERVGDEMDRVKKSIIDEKFGNNWNYALSK